MIFDNSQDNLCGLLNNPLRNNPHRICLRDFDDWDHGDRKILFDATLRIESGKAYRTQTQAFYCALIPFARFANDSAIRSLPKTKAQWQSMLLDFQSHYLKNTQSNATYASRCRMWDDPVYTWLRGMASESVMPIGVRIPRCNLPAPVVEPGTPMHPRLIGPTRVGRTPVDQPINKTLAGPIFWRTEVEYLDEIETILRDRNCVVRDVLDDHWLRLTKDYRVGKNMIRKISVIELAMRTERCDWKSTLVRPKVGRHAADRLQLTHPSVPNNCEWALAIAKHQLRISENAECLSTESLVLHPAMQWNFLHKSKSTLNWESYTALRPQQIERLGARLLFLRLLGILNNVDLAVAVAILIQEHPQFTPEALISARLINSRGKSSLLVADGGQSRIFSVDKQRASSRKYALLSPRAARVMKHVVRATSLIREMLKRTGSKFWRYLFLGCAAGPTKEVGLVQITSQQLNNRDKYSVATFYPELAQQGVEDSFDFAKLRATQGVLEWFSTGSILKASRRLGNSYRVSLDNYIPGPLLALWNERIIRSFQNVLIVLAASSEEYLLDVSDFENLGDLQKFLVRIVEEYPAEVSPVGALIQRQFGHLRDGSTKNEAQAIESSLLTLRLDEYSVALLMAFQRWALAHLSPNELETPEETTGLSPSAFVDLAEFLNHAAESDTIGEALRESLALSRLKIVHTAAQRLVPEIYNRFRGVRLHMTWESEHA